MDNFLDEIENAGAGSFQINVSRHGKIWRATVQDCDLETIGFSPIMAVDAFLVETTRRYRIHHSEQFEECGISLDECARENEWDFLCAFLQDTSEDEEVE